ncbi:MAG: hypothetical protein AAF518_28125 [Spirochaetota bacterium]
MEKTQHYQVRLPGTFLDKSLNRFADELWVSILADIELQGALPNARPMLAHPKKITKAKQIQPSLPFPQIHL